MRKDTSPKRTLVVTVGLRRKFLTPNSAQNPKYAKLPSLHHIAIKDERDPENYSVNIGMVVSEHLVSNRNGLIDRGKPFAMSSSSGTDCYIFRKRTYIIFSPVRAQ